jgi:hypothetical protein
VRPVHDGSRWCLGFGKAEVNDKNETLKMATRTIESTLTFRRPFALSGVDRPLGAGTYRVVVDEQDIPELSFLVYRRTATMLHLPAMSARTGANEVFIVDPDELAAAVEADRRDN